MAKTRTRKTSSETRPAVRTATAVRNTSIPKGPATVVPERAEVTHDAIARRAYEISQSPEAGDEMSNWLRAERELRGG